MDAFSLVCIALTLIGVGWVYGDLHGFQDGYESAAEDFERLSRRND